MNDADVPHSPQRRPDADATQWTYSSLDSTEANPDGGAALTWSWTFIDPAVYFLSHGNGDPYTPAEGASNAASGNGTADPRIVTHFSYSGGEAYTCPGTPQGTEPQDDGLPISYDY